MGWPAPVMRTEHQQFRALLGQIEGRLQKSEAVEEPACELTQALALHNQKEETVLYPWIDELLTETEEAGARRTDAHDAPRNAAAVTEAQ